MVVTGVYFHGFVLKIAPLQIEKRLSEALPRCRHSGTDRPYSAPFGQR
jgi:hypothetical protein